MYRVEATYEDGTVTEVFNAESKGAAWDEVYRLKRNAEAAYKVRGGRILTEVGGSCTLSVVQVDES